MANATRALYEATQVSSFGVLAVLSCLNCQNPVIGERVAEISQRIPSEMRSRRRSLSVRGQTAVRKNSSARFAFSVRNLSGTLVLDGVDRDFHVFVFSVRRCSGRANRY